MGGCLVALVLLVVGGVLAYNKWGRDVQEASPTPPVAKDGAPKKAPPAAEDADAKKPPSGSKDEPLQKAEPPAEGGATKGAMPPATVKNESGYRLGWNTAKGSFNVWNLSDQGTAKVWPGTKSTVYFHLPSGKVIPAELVSGGRYAITREGKGLKVTKLP
jgi:hypothetical protein